MLYYTEWDAVILPASVNNVDENINAIDGDNMRNDSNVIINDVIIELVMMNNNTIPFLSSFFDILWT